MTVAEVNPSEVNSRVEPRGGGFAPVVTGVSRLGTVFVNLYAVDLPDGRWVLVDTGLPGFADYVRRAAEKRYGPGARPAAIVLTHGHFDHAGNVKALADRWRVPVYAYPLELPYLTGRSDYPPQDPTPGGAISFFSRFFPTRGVDLGDHVQPFNADGSIPQMPGWRWIPTPGHTVGHVSLFRTADRVLLAGDAVITTDLDAWSSQVGWPIQLSPPPTPLTPDWLAARGSIYRLADVAPSTIASGHGFPISRPRLADDLRDLAAGMTTPRGGRYSADPARYLPDGSVASVPGPVSDPLLWRLAIGGAATAVLVGFTIALARRSRRDHWSRSWTR